MWRRCTMAAKTTRTSKKDKVEVYQDKRGEWRWRLMDADGRVIGASSEGYVDKADAE
ncbi:MAG: DUF1508 domain-containing protein, partial [Pseudomonadota bacterium]